MKRLFVLFQKPISLLLSSLICFGQLASIYVLGCICDQGLARQPFWMLPVGFSLLFSVGVVFVAVWMSCEKGGYSIGKITIPSSYWFFYSLLIACFLCFALFGSISFFVKDSLVSQGGFITIALSALTMVADGFAFFSASAGFRC